MNNSNKLKDYDGKVIEVFLTFLKLGLTSFGGPIAHLGYFRKALVEDKGWVDESQFSQLLAICQFLPGPASSQLGFSLGLLRAGWLGALAAFVGFTLPSVILLIAFASVLPYFSSDVGIAAINGLKLVACVVVADAVIGMSKNLCPDKLRKTIAIIALSALVLFDSAWLQIGVVVCGGVVGFLLCESSLSSKSSGLSVRFGRGLGLAFLVTFFIVLLGLSMFASNSANLFSIADAFNRAGALVFGGGHVVLPLLEDSVVANGWVSSENFLAGYGAAQAIPGPMFSFAAYLGFLTPTEYGSLINALVATVFMFLPGFLLVAAALPLWQSISRNNGANKAIAGINAAVVGLLAAAFYDPIFTSGISSGTDLAIALVGFGLLNVWKLSPLVVVFWCTIASMSPVFI